MKTATVRDLRVTFPKVEKWLNAGESIQITKRNRVVGVLVPPIQKKELHMPDFEVRMSEIFPSKFCAGDNIVRELIAERDSEK
jgi:antitoxin (DNA-binding transcriptional repressor) of toxin-antitoxin stability system